MKELSILAACFATIAFTACGNKTAQNAESAVTSAASSVRQAPSV